MEYYGLLLSKKERIYLYLVKTGTELEESLTTKRGIPYLDFFKRIRQESGIDETIEFIPIAQGRFSLEELTKIPLKPKETLVGENLTIFEYPPESEREEILRGINLKPLPQTKLIKIH